MDGYIYREPTEPSTNRSFRFLPHCKFIHGLHVHPDFEITFIVNGEGKRVIGTSQQKFYSGDLVLVGSEVPHLWKIDENYKLENTPDARVIQFRIDSWGRTYFLKPEFVALRLLLEKSNRGIVFSGKTAKKAKAIMLSMNSMKDYEQYVAAHDILCLFVNCPKEEKEYLMAENTILKNFFADPTLNEYVQFLKRNVKTVNIDLISHEFKVDNRSIQLLFKRYTAKSCARYIKLYRIKKAKEFLICFPSMQIKEVANKVGFGDSNFSKTFVKEVGVSPDIYRKSILSADRSVL